MIMLCVCLFAEIFPVHGKTSISSASNRQAETEGSTKMKVCDMFACNVTLYVNLYLPPGSWTSREV